jgi:hypothetical protein
MVIDSLYVVRSTAAIIGTVSPVTCAISASPRRRAWRRARPRKRASPHVAGGRVEQGLAVRVRSGGAGSVQRHLAGVLFHHPVMHMLLGDVLDVWVDVTGLDEESVWR